MYNKALHKGAKFKLLPRGDFMKRSFFYLVVLIITVFVTLPLHSQKVEEAELYYMNFPILKAYQHNEGYYIIYRKPNLQTAEAFIPHKWFSPKDGRGEVKKINSRISPYMSVFVKNGKFEFVKVSLPINNPQHPVWGFISNPAEYNDKFSNESLEIKF